MSQLQLFSLTQTEYRQRTEDLVALLRELAETEEAKAATARQFAEDIKALKARVAKYREILANNAEWRDAPLQVPRVLQDVAKEINAGAMDEGATQVRATGRREGGHG